ncbi:unnamed protein product [Rotaria socialis]|uniref:Uncharacterized protein n=1 Tax=Rotaria socialis TaxID=392032 RepID=A0A820HD68_9BILA|nr:unnamed protein product [Rotaria socialis]CAF3552907.1 unnamed protein product [Rotaria socialis]CAF3588345.1 unnamed protein product [Rotaria socialis]CAF4290595.1 unnamed protein product [Rotaria socialis]CAF4403823.1 unnamed protein product [Rotaria socialis]
MSTDKQNILNDLNLKESFYSTPIMFSRDSSMETLSSFNVNFHSHNSTYTSEHSTNPSGILSPSDIPDSPPRGLDDDIDTIEQQKTFIQPLNITRSTGSTIIERSDNYIYDDNDVDSIRNYAISPPRIAYDDDDDDDDNDSIRSSLSSLTLPPPPSSSSSSAAANNTILSSINDLRNLKHNLSIINEESLHEHNEHPKSSFNTTDTTITTTTDEDEDDEDQKGKRLLFELIRQRLPHHHVSLTSASDSSSKINDIDCQDKPKGTSSSSSSSINDQTMREDSSNHGLSSHDITIPSSAMQESGYDSLLPTSSSAPKRSLSNASISTTRSITTKKKHRCDEENADPMNGNNNNNNNNTEYIDDDDDDHYDKKAGEALLRNLIAQVLPSFNPRYLNGGGDDDDDDDDHEDEDEVISNPRRPSPISQTYSSSNASSVRSVDIEIEINKKSEKNLCVRSNKNHITDIIQQEKIHSKRTYIHRPVHQTKSSELRRLQTHSRR